MKKKILMCALLVFATVFAACSGQDEKEPNRDNSTEVTDESGTSDDTSEGYEEDAEDEELEVIEPSVDVIECKFTFDGKQYTMGCNASEFYDDGWSPSKPFVFSYYKTDTKRVLKDKDNYFVDLTLENPDHSADEELDSDNSRSAQLSVIAFALSAVDWGSTDDLPEFDFYGINNNSSKDEMISILGNQWYGHSVRDDKEIYQYLITEDKMGIDKRSVAVEIRFNEQGKIDRFCLCSRGTFNYW